MSEREILVPQAARVDALEAGFDGPATLRLAVLERPTYFEVPEALPRVLQELGLAQITVGEAALRVANYRGGPPFAFGFNISLDGK
jgi:hypothetical protein